ncbi:hypothetical protein, partial [Oenococcus oeni]
MNIVNNLTILVLRLGIFILKKIISKETFWTAFSSILSSISILVVYLTNMKQINSVQEENRNSVRPLLGLKIAPYGLGNSHYD